MSILELNTIRKRQVDPVLPKLKKFKAGHNKKYEVKITIDSTIYD